MANIVSAIFLCITFGLLGVMGTYPQLQIHVEPVNAVESLTNAVHFFCFTSGLDGKNISTIRLEKDTSNGIIATFTKSDQITKVNSMQDRVQVSGLFNNADGSGYLKVSLMNPVKGDTAIYTCSLDYEEAEYPSRPFNVADVGSLIVKKFAENFPQIAPQQSLQLEGLVESSGRIAFFIRLDQNIFMKKNEDIVFDKADPELASGYNFQTGEFTVPVTGLYSFFLTLRIDNRGTSAIHAHLMLDDTSYTKMAWHPSRKGIPEVQSTTSLALVKAGTKVKVMIIGVKQVDLFIVGGMKSMFGGHLLNAF